MRRQLYLGFAVLLVSALLLSACQSGPTAEEIVARMKEVQASAEDAHAIVDFSVSAQTMEMDFTVEMWEKSPNKFRLEVLEDSEARFAGAVSVTDGNQVWMYDPGENEVVTGPVGEFGVDEPLDPRQVIELMQGMIDQVLDHSDVELDGEEKLDGVPTYRLMFTPKEGEESNLPMPLRGDATLWVEQDSWVALQAHFEGSAVGDGWMRVRSYEFDGGVPDERFQFEVPEGAIVRTIEEVQPTPMTLDEALADAAFSLRAPTYVPEDATLIDVFKIDGAYVFRYDHSAISFTIVQGTSEIAGQLPAGETSEVSVQGEVGSLVTDGLGHAFLSWSEEEVTITIAGQVSQEEILKIANSLQ